MPSSVRIPFSQDLITEALKYTSEDCIVVFPTKVSAAVAYQRYMDTWNLENCRFLSIDELKQECLLPAAPCVSDDKRLLCLYQVLEEEDLDNLHISEYFDIVEWGRHFFHFFEELSDECIDALKLHDVFGNFGFNLLAWQEDFLSSVLCIRDRYKNMLASIGFTDPIFYRINDRIILEPLIKRYVFVNQYYYSALEKAIITSIEKTGAEVVVIEQSLQLSSEAKSLNISNINREQINTQEIRVIECSNEDQMVLDFISRSSTQPGKSVLVDNHFHSKHYNYLFDRQLYNRSYSVSIMHTGVFKVLTVLYKHLQDIDQSLESSYLPLRSFISACTQENFVKYYNPDWGRSEINALLSELRDLLAQNILYIDLELQLFNLLLKGDSFQFLPKILKPHFALLQTIATVSDPDSLLTLIDIPNGLELQRMCSEQELKNSDIIEKCYERMANFQSLGTLGIVSSWSGLFKRDGIELATSLLRLFLESLTTVKIHFEYQTIKTEARTDISNLLDLRNLQYNETTIFHAIEGEYPSNPGAIWLFSENQRGNLGLKSYSEIRERERYYFFRQIFTSQSAVIYFYRNQEQDVQPGSFVTELLHQKKYLESIGVSMVEEKPSKSISELYTVRKQLYQDIFNACDRQEINQNHGLDRESPGDFFAIPASPQTDFGDSHRLKAAYYSLKTLYDNPFCWYLTFHCRLKESELRPRETISDLLFGALLHGYLSKVLDSLRGTHLGCAELETLLNNPTFLSEKLNELITESLYRFKLPHNYNYEFLVSVIFECLVNSIRSFYRNFLFPNLQQKSFEFIPETEDMSDLQSHKTIGTCVIDNDEFCLDIQGKADLRIECADEFFIIDFKTGHGSPDQLVCYEWFYYLLDEDFNSQNLKSTFWQVLTQGIEKGTDDKSRQKWKTKMLDSFEKCLNFGFSQGRNAESRQTLRQITRADLYLPANGGSDE